uniref:V-set and transmembrane domain-containing protein 1 n=1 Tax=Jaculus jaculus TaxID=51337 RepID=UPI001E1B5712|nr:V-set and transmembrane domain-containing protein 1 [Jaculus jaculus]
MGSEFLCLLCLGLSLGCRAEEKNETLPRPSLSAWPSSVAEHESNVTLRCWTHFHNVTVMLRRLHDSGYQQEQSSAGNKAEFSLTDVQPKDAGEYFCAYKMAVSSKWSEESQRLQLVVTGISEPLQTKKVRKNQTDFMLCNVTSKDNGNYSCVHYQCNWPYLGSSPSHGLEIRVSGKHEAVCGTPGTQHTGGCEFEASLDCAERPHAAEEVGKALMN